MIIYQYDGTIDGYLTCVYDAWNRNIDTALFNTNMDTCQLRLDSEIVTITPSDDDIDKLLIYLKKAIGGRGLGNVYHAFASSDKQKDIVIMNYILLALKQGKIVKSMLSHPYVILFDDIVRKVRSEIHKMSGFIRFVKTKSELYYAAYSPENDITCFLTREFRDRFPIMSFVLHDVLRGIIGIYNGEDYMIVHDDRKATIEYADDEKQIEKLWQKYYESVNIKERYNRRQMLNYMPIKYMKNVHTFNDFDISKIEKR